MKEKVLPYKQKYKGIQGLIVVKPDELNTAITSYTDIGATYNTIVDDFAKRVVERTGGSSAGHDDTKRSFKQIETEITLIQLAGKPER